MAAIQLAPGGTYLDTFKKSFVDVPVDAAKDNSHLFERAAGGLTKDGDEGLGSLEELLGGDGIVLGSIHGYVDEGLLERIKIGTSGGDLNGGHFDYKGMREGTVMRGHCQSSRFQPPLLTASPVSNITSTTSFLKQPSTT